MQPGPVAVSLDDYARFSPRDPLALVVASFTCPLCLCQASVMSLIREEEGGVASCRCERCEAAWMLAMEAGQFLRVALAPPIELVLMGAADWSQQPGWRYPF
jgi:hypothetical protein